MKQLPFNYSYYSSVDEGTNINISPLIDMMFILLIFFIVATSFIKETGIAIEKPTAVTATQLEAQSIMIGITDSGEIYLGGNPVSLAHLQSVVKQEIIVQPDKPITIVADKNSRTAVLIDVIDRCKLAGAKTISLASERKDRLQAVDFSPERFSESK